MTVITAVIVFPFTTTTFVTSSPGPVPFSNETAAPLTKPEPEIVADAVVPVD